jgi:hypothetical membrane protein
MKLDLLSLLPLVGIALMTLAVVYSASIYRGKRAERFSLVNHFISELGEVGVSRGARIFNAGLTVCGLLLFPFVIHLGLLLDSTLGWIGTAAGVLASLGVAAVGLFPMNDLKLHVPAAMTFFRAGLGMVVFTGLAIQFQPAAQVVIPKQANGFSLLAGAAFASFLLRPLLKRSKKDPRKVLDPEAEPERPRFWWYAFLEWMVFFNTILWLFGMSLFA